MKSTQKFSVCFDLIRSLLFSVFSLLKKRNGSQNVSIEKSFNSESLNITTIHNLLKNKGTFYLNAHTRDISYFVGNRERGYLFSLPCRFQQCCRQSFQFPIRILKNFSNNDIWNSFMFTSEYTKPTKWRRDARCWHFSLAFKLTLQWNAPLF